MILREYILACKDPLRVKRTIANDEDAVEQLGITLQEASELREEMKRKFEELLILVTEIKRMEGHGLSDQNKIDVVRLMEELDLTL